MKILKFFVLVIILSIGKVTYGIANTPYNIATKAKLTASTSLNNSTMVENIADGIIGIDGRGEWACEGDTTDWGYVRFPWVQLTWANKQKVNKIILFDRPNLKDHIASGKLIFSDGSEIWITQIPNDGKAKEVRFPTKNISWVKFQTTDGKGRDIGFSEIEVYSTENSDFVSWVDPYIESSRGRYIFFITGQRPFGMVGAAPLTRNKNQNGGGYNYNDDEILGFEQLHAWMIGGLEIMPTNMKVNPNLGQNAWKSKFSHDAELVHPGYHRVFLENDKIWVENTATERVSFYKFTYTKPMETQILTNLSGYVGNSTMEDAKINRINNREFEGSFSSVKRYWGGPNNVKVFFVIQFDRGFTDLSTWDSKIQGQIGGVAAKYKLNAGTK